MRHQLAETSVNSVPVRQIIAASSEWIHILGSDESHYLVPTVPHTYFLDCAFCDVALLKAVGISTADATILSSTTDLAAKAGLAASESSDAALYPSIGWRLPKGGQGTRLLQVLPTGWLPRITNRQQFMEVMILDAWFRRGGRRQVIFTQTGQDIGAIFLPSGSPIGTQKPTAQEAGYSQTAVYNGLSWAATESAIRAKLAALSISKLVQQFNGLPQIGVGHRTLKTLCFEAGANRVCFDQPLIDLMGRLFGGAVYANDQSASELSANRLRPQCDSGARHSMGRTGG